MECISGYSVMFLFLMFVFANNMLNILRCNINFVPLYRRSFRLFVVMMGMFVQSNSVAQVKSASPFNTIGYGYNKTKAVAEAHELDNEPEEMVDSSYMIKPPMDSLNVYVPTVALPLRTIRVNSPYGMRRDPLNRLSSRMHSGIDLQARFEEVFSMLPGTVTAATYSTNGGYYVTVNHGACVCSYLHLSRILVRVGQHVKAGQVIAISGNTGKRTTGPHLHISCRWGNEKGRFFDPMLLLGFVSKQLKMN